jgi:IstB-like ATP binding protein
MLTHPTLDQLKALKLDGMADAFVELQNQAQAAELAHTEWLALLLDREAANRNTKRFQIRLRSAKLRHGQAAIEDVDYRTPRRLDKALFQQLTAGKWIAEHRNLLVTGRAASASRGYLARSPRRRAGMATRCSTPAYRGCLPIWNSPTVTVASRACSAPWSRPIC